MLVSDLWKFGGIDADDVFDACQAAGVKELVPGDPESPIAPDEVEVGRWGGQRWPTPEEADAWGWSLTDRRRWENCVTFGGGVFVSPSRATITDRPD